MSDDVCGTHGADRYQHGCTGCWSARQARRTARKNAEQRAKIATYVLGQLADTMPNSGQLEEHVKTAVKYADALLEELEK